ncbi:hypothetical protein ERJ75_001392700 [Trypanosoma vivax]|nr:hypothetical protein ERJ75_001392700 [Trypanosoma vivax]
MCHPLGGGGPRRGFSIPRRTVRSAATRNSAALGDPSHGFPQRTHVGSAEPPQGMERGPAHYRAKEPHLHAAEGSPLDSEPSTGSRASASAAARKCFTAETREHEARQQIVARGNTAHGREQQLGHSGKTAE